MKKIKYYTTIRPQKINQLDQLREGDEVCGAVLDTLSQDYLGYIENLVKHSKTPQKKGSSYREEKNRVLSQDQEKMEAELQFEQSSEQRNIQQLPKSSSRKQNRSHSQKFPISNYPSKKAPQKLKHPPISPNIPQSRLSFQKFHNNQTIKQNQRGVAYTQHHHQDMLNKMNITNKYTKQLNSSKRLYSLNKSSHGKPQRMNTLQNTNSKLVEGSRESQLSIELPIKTSSSSNQENQPKFLSNINDYIYQLQSEQQQQPLRRSSKTKQSFIYHPHKPKSKSKPAHNQQYIDNILKQNLKLKKKVTSYHQKIEDLEEEYSRHLIKCHKKQQTNKERFMGLHNSLIQAVNKLAAQKQQIGSLQNFIKSFNKKSKQYQYHEDSDSYQELEEDIRQSLLRSRPVEKSKRKRKRFEDTMPRNQEQYRW